MQKWFYQAREGSITVRDIPGDGSANPSRQHTDSRRARQKHVSEWGSEASTSRSVDKGKQKIEDQKPSQLMQKRTYEVLQNYIFSLKNDHNMDENRQKEITGFWKKEFSKAKSESNLKDIIKHLGDSLGGDGKTYPEFSTSMGMDKGKQKIEGQGSRQIDDDINVQQRFAVILKEYKFLEKNRIVDEHYKHIILYLCKRFSEAKKTSEQEKYVEKLADYLRKSQPDKYGSEGQIEIDKELGYLLKDSNAKLDKVKEKVDNFLDSKDKNKTDGKETTSWPEEIGTYLFDHQELMNDLIYNELYKHLANRSKKGNSEQVHRDNDRQQSNQTEQDLRAQLGPGGIQRQIEVLRYYEQIQQQQPERAHRPIQLPEHDGSSPMRQWPQRQELLNPEQGQIQHSQRAPEQRLVELRERDLRYLTPPQFLEYSQLLDQQQPTNHQKQLVCRYEADQLYSYLRRQQSNEILQQAASHAHNVMVRWDASLQQRGQELEQRLAESGNRNWGDLISSDLRRISGILATEQQDHMILRRRVSKSFRKNLDSLNQHLNQRLSSLRESRSADRYESYGLTLYNLKRALDRTNHCLQKLRDYDQRRLTKLRTQEFRAMSPVHLLEYSQLLRLDQQRQRPMDQQEQFALWHEADRVYSHLRRQQQPEILHEINTELSQIQQFQFQFNASFQQREQELEQGLAEPGNRNWEGLISSDLCRISGILATEQQDHMSLRRRVSKSFRKNLDSLNQHLNQRLGSLRESGRADRYESYGLTLYNLDRALKRTNECLGKLRDYDQQRQQTQQKSMLKRMYSILRCVRPRVSE